MYVFFFPSSSVKPMAAGIQVALYASLFDPL